MKLDEALGQLYAQGLLAVARVDGEIGPEEGALLRQLVADRASIEIDHEQAFFHKVTSDELAAAAAKAGIDSRELGRAFASDAAKLAIVDGDLNGGEAQLILRYVRALGCSDDDVRHATRDLDAWLH